MEPKYGERKAEPRNYDERKAARSASEEDVKPPRIPEEAREYGNEGRRYAGEERMPHYELRRPVPNDEEPKAYHADEERMPPKEEHRLPIEEERRAYPKDYAETRRPYQKPYAQNDEDRRPFSRPESDRQAKLHPRPEPEPRHQFP